MAGTVWVDLLVDGSCAEGLADELLGTGALATSVEDAFEGTEFEEPIYLARLGEQEWFATPEGDQAGGKVWPASRVRALFASGSDVQRSVGEAAAVLGLDSPDFEVGAEMIETDWVEEVRRINRETMRGGEISPGLRILPEWDAEAGGAPGETTILLEPGLAFGTGDHPTTRLCLQWLQGALRGGETVLDYGTGSGVLAIGALLLGARAGSAVDIDPMSIVAAQHNLERNGVAERCEVLLHDGGEEDPPPCAPGSQSPGEFDVLVANILQGPLIELEPRLASYVRPGGGLALSGVLTTQSEEVVAAYSRSFEGLQVSSCPDGKWACICGTRRGA